MLSQSILCNFKNMGFAEIVFQEPILDALSRLSPSDLCGLASSSSLCRRAAWTARGRSGVKLVIPRADPRFVESAKRSYPSLDYVVYYRRPLDTDSCIKELREGAREVGVAVQVVRRGLRPSGRRFFSLDI